MSSPSIPSHAPAHGHGTLTLRRDLVVQSFDAVFAAWTGVAREHAEGKNLALFLPSLLLADAGALRRVFDEGKSTSFHVTLDVRSGDEPEPVRVLVKLRPTRVGAETHALFEAERVDRVRNPAGVKAEEFGRELRSIEGRLRALGLFDDAAVLEDALSSFSASVRESHSKLVEHIQLGDASQAASYAHRLKGAASNLGAARLTAAAFAVELALRTAASDVAQLLTNLGTAVEAAVSHCEQLTPRNP